MSNIKSKKNIKRILAVFVLIMLFFTNYGMPLYAVAAETAELFESTLFRKEELSMTAAFSDGKEEKVANVNDQVTMTVEINPLVDGYLKQGLLSLNSKEIGENNYKIVSISQEGEDESNSKYNSRVNSDTTNAVSGLETKKQAELLDESLVSGTNNELISQESIIDDSQENQVNSDLQVMQSNQENINDVALTTEELPYVVPQGENPIGSNGNDITVETVEQIQSQITTQDQTIIINKDDDFVTDDLSEIATEDVDVDVLVDEEDYINQVHTDTTQEQIKRIFIDASSVTLKSNNQVLIENVSSKTKINITIAYQMSDVLDVNKLQEDINIDLSGTFVNEDLEEVLIQKNSTVSLGWKYSTGIELTSEYTKISPFTVNNTNGTIVENEIRVKREINDKKYLPLKSTTLEIKIPTLNNNKPMMVDVMSKGLMATKGESIENLTFDKSNWNYDENTGSIKIVINNLTDGKVLNTKGEDIYVITYRYEEYIGSSNIELAKNMKLTAEEYSNQINTITKDISSESQQEIEAGEIITYSMASNDSKISKSNIYANYFVDDKSAEFSSVVTVKILTQDMLERLTLFDMQETYIDKNQNAFKATDDVTYKAIKFRYREIEDLLKSGTEIIVIDSEDRELYRFTKENTTNDETSQVTFEGDFKNLQVIFSNVSSNGSVNVEFVKEIKQSNYTMYQYTMFAKLQSSLRAKIKYTGLDEEYNLKEINDIKDFSESYTKANIYMNPASLNTVRKNENVEFKISLNNDQKTSDIYKNPGFEIVFPEYITNIDIQNIKIVNNENLRIDDFRTYEYDGSIRIKISLIGVEQKFNVANLTGGTNILLNCNIDVSEFAPKKEDEIKLYYYNEAVSNYWTQTMWKINESAPSGLIRATNGFDAVAFDYQAPSGLVNAVGIRNYDGMLGFVSSVKQGITTAEIRRDAESQIATMELTTLNNTSNPCSDLVLLGRIPFKGNRDVITGEDLGTTVDTKLVGMIRSNQSNPYNSIIYYSTNENANKNLNDANNNWVEASYWTDITKAKSYLIVVKGTIKPGDIYKYSYPFSIPEDLTFDNKMYGSFGAYYNNISSTAVVYESSSSDKVGLTTGASPNLEVKLTSSKGESEVKEFERITYTVTVINTSSLPMENVVLHYHVPDYTELMQHSENPNTGDIGWTIYTLGDFASQHAKTTNGSTTYDDLTFEDLGTIEANKSVSFEYTVKVKSDEGKEIKNKVEVIADNLNGKVYSNEIVNSVKESYFDKYLRAASVGTMSPGSQRVYNLSFKNESKKDLDNVKLVFHFPSFEKVTGADIGNRIVNSQDSKVIIDNNTNKVTYNIGSVKKNGTVVVAARVEGIAITSVSKQEDLYFEVYADNVISEKSTVINEVFLRPLLVLKEATSYVPSSINENEGFTVQAEITNNGSMVSSKAKYELAYSEELVVDAVSSVEAGEINYKNTNGKLLITLPTIEPGSTYSYNVRFRAQNLSGSSSSKATIERTLYADYQNDQKIDPIIINVNNNLLTKEEEQEQKAKEEAERIRQAEETAKRQAQEEAERIKNNQNNSNSQNNNKPNQQTTNNSQTSSSTNSNVNNNKNNNSNANNSNNQTNQVPQTVSNVAKYDVTGKVWLDINKNGMKDNDEQDLKDIVVTLVNGETGKSISTTNTSGSGRYGFTGLEQGIYYVTFKFDNNKYSPTIFQNNGVDNTKNSDATLSVEDTSIAVTQTFSLTENLDDVDLGLVEKSAFDIEVHKYLVGATIKYNNGKSVHYNYNNKELAKIEIRSRYLNGATVELEYQVALKNIGRIEGYAEQVIDVIPSDMENSEKNNGLWSLGNDGKLYSQNLANMVIKPGETRSLGLVLVKHMTEDNTGVVSNRAELISSISDEKASENDENNSNVQNTFIMPATGSEVHWITYTLIGVFTAVLIYLLVTKKIKIPTKKVYR